MIKIYGLSLLATLTALGALFVMIDPRQLPSIALFGVFGLIYAAIALIIIIFLLILKIILGVEWRTSTIRRVGISIALLPTFLLLLQSVGQLTVRDSILAVMLTVLLYVYLHRMFGNSDSKEITKI